VKRIDRLERLDTGDYTPRQYQHCLYQLGRVGRLLGGDRATLVTLSPIAKELSSVLEVGCGGGHMAALLAKKFPHLSVVGIDLNPNAVKYAKNHHSLPNLRFEEQLALKLPDDASQYDLISAHLVCHHMKEQEIVHFLREADKSARKAVLINDLHRHCLAYLSYLTIAPLLFRDRMIWEDGRLSIRRSFTRSDWIGYLAQAGIPPERYQLRWHWPFRWTLLIQTIGPSGNM
jgi:2-polyprenyl-3-methyl-5-hydroxy-6-metoxy-1,4-benzoquinol methylase